MKYIPTIGLEMHCEVKSNSKVFSSAENKYNEIPNSNVRPLDLALPGTLPILNKTCAEKAIKMATILNCTIADYFVFDRKNYYYPDLPKGYQITQNTFPIGINGYLDIEVNNKIKRVLIHDIHLEEDAASLDHFIDSSHIDYNRCGVPLLETVTEPCFSSSEEALAFLEYMRLVFKYADISDADTKKGQIRCDVNVSIRPENETKLGTKVEIKNVNTYSNVVKVIDYEIKRQTKLYEEGHETDIIQETRRYDEEKDMTISMRSKVDSIDYKYFIEPNIPKIKISNELKDNIKNTIPVLPLERKNIYLNKYNLNEYDANIIVKDKEVSDYYDECLKLKLDPKESANWLLVQILGYVNKNNMNLKDCFVTPNRLKVILDNLKKGNISSKQAKEVFNKVLETKTEPENFIDKNNAQITDEEELQAIIDRILDNSEVQIKDYKNGRTNLFDYFVGQVMKETKGKANPNLTKKLITNSLTKR